MACGHDVAALERTGQLTMADANETLAAFMVGQLPDADLFRQKIGGLLDVATGGRLDVTVRAYGEMVNELWRDGNPEGAIRLEALWNELFSLLCGYAIGNFYREAHVTGFHDVCSQHAHVLPTEGYPTSADEGSRLREIAKLQPDRDGYGMIHAIRTHPSADVRAIRAIAVTSYAGDHYRARAISAGYDEYIAKPVEPARLTQVVSDLIRRHPRAHAAT